MRVLQRLTGRHAGRVLQSDAELLATVLYGDDMTMSQGDPLLTGIRTTAYGTLLTGSHSVTLKRPHLSWHVYMATSQMRFSLGVSDHSIPTLERLTDSDSEEELSRLCGMASKYHRNK